MKTVNVVVFIGSAPAHKPLEVLWRERKDFSFQVRGDVYSTRKREAKALFTQRYPDFRVVSISSSAGGKYERGTLLLNARRKSELATHARLPGWVPVRPGQPGRR